VLEGRSHTTIEQIIELIFQWGCYVGAVAVVSERHLGMLDHQELTHMRSFYTLSQMYQYINPLPDILSSAVRTVKGSEFYIFLSTVVM
jgi:hypothetical protein